MLLQGICHAVKSVVIDSNFEIFDGGKSPDPQMKLISLAPGTPNQKSWLSAWSEIFIHRLARFYTSIDPCKLHVGSLAV